jgi:hypothetical protein
MATYLVALGLWWQSTSCGNIVDEVSHLIAAVYQRMIGRAQSPNILL